MIIIPNTMTSVSSINPPSLSDAALPDVLVIVDFVTGEFVGDKEGDLVVSSSACKLRSVGLSVAIIVGLDAGVSDGSIVGFCVVGKEVGASVVGILVIGLVLGSWLGIIVGSTDGVNVGCFDGDFEGLVLGDFEGMFVGLKVGVIVGCSEGNFEGIALGDWDGDIVSTLQLFRSKKVMHKKRK